MKRGLIEWDKTELPESVLVRRVGAAKEYMRAHGLDGLAAFTSMTQADVVRYFTHFLPYFNRAVYLMPLEGEPVLLCGLSNRVYNWIRSTSTIDDIQASRDLGASAAKAMVERGLKRVGLLDRATFPVEILSSLEANASGVQLVNADELRDGLRWGLDADEVRLRSKAGALASKTIAEVELRAGLTAGEFAAHVDRTLRLATAEDVLLQIDSGQGWPGSPGTSPLGSSVRILAQVEYKGHWVQIGRTRPGPAQPGWFRELAAGLKPGAAVRDVVRQAGADVDLRLYASRGGSPFTGL
ncbi:MAG: aminopeptidase P family N-terminal domain-containing protein, partial [Chloroflexota bacterium]|nr:aminopeptidase P family N-terminal domain-containing protein [Chloroflexota bacterium]